MPAKDGSGTLAELATRTGGSPSRRGPTEYAIGRPTTDSAAAMTSRFENPPPLPEVADERLGGSIVAGGRGLDGPQVRVGEVGDMDVIADAGAVGCRVVVTEHRQLAAPLGGHQDVRDEMCLGRVVFAECLGRAGDVEVAESDGPEAVCPAVPAERAFERALRVAVRVDRPKGSSSSIGV